MKVFRMGDKVEFRRWQVKNGYTSMTRPRSGVVQGFSEHGYPWVVCGDGQAAYVRPNMVTVLEESPGVDYTIGFWEDGRVQEFRCVAVSNQDAANQFIQSQSGQEQINDPLPPYWIARVMGVACHIGQEKIKRMPWE